MPNREIRQNTRKKVFHFVFFACFAVIFLLLPFPAAAQWIKQKVDTTASLRGLSVVNEKVVWASGTGGTVIRTIDGGKTWKVMTVPGAEKLDFRDVEAFDANTAYILSIGNGESSRIYKTTDGGKAWIEQFRNKNEKAFFDAIACWEPRECAAISDPVNGRFFLISTGNGGDRWDFGIDREHLKAKDGEAAFAASGTSLVARRGWEFYIVTGGTDARVFRGDVFLDNFVWRASDTPIAKGTTTTGIFSIAMSPYKRDEGIIVGGDYQNPKEAKNNLALTTDRGATWKLGSGLTGYRSGVTYVDSETIVAVGTNGSDVSRDGGKTWRPLGDENLNAVQSKGPNATWAVGPNGLVVKHGIAVVEKGTRVTNKYHWPVGNVERFELSHEEISTNCSTGNSRCSDKRVIQLSVSSPAFDDTPLEYVYVISGGKIVGKGANVEWDLSTALPGTYTITAKACIPNTDPKFGCYGKTETRQVVIR